MKGYATIGWSEVFEAAKELDEEHGTLTFITFARPVTGTVPYFISIKLYDCTSMEGSPPLWEYRAPTPKGRAGAMEPAAMLALQSAHVQYYNAPWSWSEKMRRRAVRSGE